MNAAEIIGILLIAIVIGAIFYYGLGRRGPWGAFWVFLLVLILAAWAGRYWITPAGPILWGYAWLPLFFWVFMIALLIGIASPTEEERIETTGTDQERIISRQDKKRAAADRESRVRATDPEASGAAAAFGIFFWLLMLIFIAAIITGLLR